VCDCDPGRRPDECGGTAGGRGGMFCGCPCHRGENGESEPLNPPPVAPPPGEGTPRSRTVCEHGCNTDDCATFCRPNFAGGCCHQPVVEEAMPPGEATALPCKSADPHTPRVCSLPAGHEGRHEDARYPVGHDWSTTHGPNRPLNPPPAAQPELSGNPGQLPPPAPVPVFESLPETSGDAPAPVPEAPQVHDGGCMRWNSRCDREKFECHCESATRPPEPAKAPLSERMNVYVRAQSFPDAEITRLWHAEVAALEAARDAFKRYYIEASAAKETTEAEPAKAPLSERMRNSMMLLASPKTIGEVADIEAELAEAKRIADNRMEMLTMVRKQRNEAQDSRDAARAEVEQLRASAVRSAAQEKREADARVLAAYRDCAKEARAVGARSYSHLQTAIDIVAAIERLPTSTGTAGGAGGEGDSTCAGCLALLERAAEMLADVQEEPDGWQEWSADREKHVHAQVDAIKVAVDKANNRAADALWRWAKTMEPFQGMTTGQFEEWLRSGADAPGAVGKGGGR